MTDGTNHFSADDTSNIAKKILQHTNAIVLAQAADHPLSIARRKSTLGEAALAANNSANATASIVGALIYMSLTVELKFSDGGFLRFTSDVWGIGGVGASEYGGTAWLNFPSRQLANSEADVQVSFIPGALEIGWFSHGTPLGTAVLGGGGLNLVGVGGGHGKFYAV